MSDFAKRSALPTVRPPSRINDLISALRNLYFFGESFYNSSTTDVIRSLLTFIEEFDDTPPPSATVCSVLATFADLMLDEFRCRVMSVSLVDAASITTKFTRSNSLLIRFRDSADAWTPLPAPSPPNHTVSTRISFKRELNERQGAQGPPEVLAALPRRGKQSLCMKYLSIADCHGGTNGRCFSKKRGHFKAQELPSIVKAYI